jgi:uncharacterized protein YraI
MTPTRLTICAATWTLLSAAAAAAAPAYVMSTVNLRSGAGTNNEIVTKIPGGSLVDATNCAEGWCEVEWQGKKGFAIATALDRSGRVPVRRGPAVAQGQAGYVPVARPAYALGPPVVYGPPVYYYPYRPYYGYGWGYRRWRRW